MVHRRYPTLATSGWRSDSLLLQLHLWPDGDVTAVITMGSQANAVATNCMRHEEYDGT